MRNLQNILVQISFNMLCIYQPTPWEYILETKELEVSKMSDSLVFKEWMYQVIRHLHIV